MISVIIPSFNRADTIERSVRSVLAQTYIDLECIVVDDGSTDATQDVVKEIEDPRLRYHRLDKNSGACVARNEGIRLAMGEYIAFQDSDDVWRENKLEVQMEALYRFDADVCFCGFVKHSIDLSKTLEIDTDLQEGIVSYEKLYEKSRVSTQTILASRTVFQTFMFDAEVKRAQDYEWTLRAGECYRFCFVATPMVDQYLQKDSITTKTEFDYQVRKEVNAYFYHKFQGKYGDNPGLQVVLLRKYAKSKVWCGENAADEYLKLYQLTKNKKEYVKHWAAQLGVLKFYFSFKEKRDTKRASELVK